MRREKRNIKAFFGVRNKMAGEMHVGRSQVEVGRRE